MSSLLYRRVLRLSRAIPQPAIRITIVPLRPYHGSPAARSPYKDDQDRQSLKPRPSEGTKSAADGDIAAHDEAAFDPRQTRPGDEKDTAGKGEIGNPLEASGANQELSKPQGDKGSKESSPGKGSGSDKKSSGAKSPAKGGKTS